MVIVKRYSRLSTLEKKRFVLAHSFGSFNLHNLLCCLGPLGRNCSLAPSPRAKQREAEGFTLALRGRRGFVHSELTSFTRPCLSFLQSLYKHTFSRNSVSCILAFPHVG